MKLLKYFVTTVVILGLLDTTEGGWLKKTIKQIGNAIEKVVKNDAVCQLLFGVACPAVVEAAGDAIRDNISGIGKAVVGIGVKVGTKACHVRKEKCKRSTSEIMLPFSDEFSDYDMNGDKWISYEEFVFTILNSVNLADAEEIREPFTFADVDGNGKLNEDEFHAAPFLFAHVNRGEQTTVIAYGPSISTTIPPLTPSDFSSRK